MNRKRIFCYGGLYLFALCCSCGGEPIELAREVYELTAAPDSQRAMGIDLGMQTASSAKMGDDSWAGARSDAGVGSSAIGGVWAAGLPLLASQSELCPGVPGQNLLSHLTYMGPVGAEYGDEVRLPALLNDGSGVPQAGRLIEFKLGAQAATAVTDVNGIATASIELSGTPGPTELSIHFAGNEELSEASTVAEIVVDRKATTVELRGSTSLAASSKAEVEAVLLDDEGAPVAGRTLSFTIGGSSGTATTDAKGLAKAFITLATTVSGPTPVTVSFVGDEFYKPAKAERSAFAYQPTSFTIWGGNPEGLSLGQIVNFWGHSWAKQVHGGGYDAHAEFKGYAESQPPFALCENQCWSSKDGNSNPPTNLPEYIGVLIPTVITKSQGTVYGNIAGLAILKLDNANRGCCSAPGKPGYGTIVAFIAGSFGPPPASLSVSQSQPKTVLPGQSFEVVAKLEARGGRAKGVTVKELFFGSLPAAASAELGDIEPGQTKTVTFGETAPAIAPRQSGESTLDYSSRLGAADGRVLSSHATVTFNEQDGLEAAPVDAHSASQLTLPRLWLSLLAPLCSGPGSSFEYVVTVNNLGSAEAATVNATLVLPDGTRFPLSIAPLASKTTIVKRIPWTVPAIAPRASDESNAAYLTRLRNFDGKELLARVEASWTDALGNAYGSIEQQAKTVERLPIITWTAGALPAFVPGLSAPLTVQLENVGSAPASDVALALMGPDGVQASAHATLAAGAQGAASLTASAPPIAAKGSSESDADYRTRLLSEDGRALAFGLTIDWSAGSASFGRQAEVLTALEYVPVLGITLDGPAKARPGETITYTVQLANAGHADAMSPELSLQMPDGSVHEVATPFTVSAGQSISVPMSFTLPQMPSGQATAVAKVRWADLASNIYGEISGASAITIESTAAPVLVATAQKPPFLLPGQSVPVTFGVVNTSEGDARSAKLELFAASGEATGSFSFELGAKKQTTTTLEITAPQVEAKGGSESDADYRTRILGAGEQILEYRHSLTWHDAGGKLYGPAEGRLKTRVIAPLLDISLSAPQAAESGETITYTIKVTNAGSADASSLRLYITMPDGSSQEIDTLSSLSDGLAREASLEVPIKWVLPGNQPSGEISATASVAWTDARGSVYGPQSGTSETAVTLVNSPPLVEAGPNQTIMLPAVATLAGSATDDGKPAALTTSWVKVSGPGAAVFSDAKSLAPVVTFSAPGEYVLRLTASDSQKTSSDQVTVTVEAPPGASKTYSANTPPAGEQLINVIRDGRQMRLDEKSKAFNFIWLAVSSKGTTVKIDTRTGKVLGEYWTSPDNQPKDPSRTTVDQNGNVWVSNRAGHSVVHIGLLENGQCVDRNGNGKIDTSTGLKDVKPWTNAGEADTNGGISTAEDECLLHYTLVSSGGTRHLSVDANNDVWVSGLGVGSWPAGIFNLLDGKTGVIKRTEGPVGYGGYGGLLDKNGVIWSSRPLLRWDPSKPLSGPNGGNWQGWDYDSYGLCIDSQGNVWNTQLYGGHIRKFSPTGEVLGTYYHGTAWAQGCAIDRNDNVWVANSRFETSVSRLDKNGKYLGQIQLLSGPTGVAVDADGKIWTSDFSAHRAQRIDPNRGVIGEVDLTTEDLGGELYNYSDMTGSTLVGMPKEGTWSFVYDSGEEGAAWGRVIWTGQIYGDGELEVKASSSEDGVAFSGLVTALNGQDIEVPDGRYLKVEVLFKRSKKGESPLLYNITVATAEYPPPTLVNAAPLVDAGADRTTSLPNLFRITGSVHDDGLPASGRLTSSWSKVSGPGEATFSAAADERTDVTFSLPGKYVLRLIAEDGEFTVSDELSVTVLAANRPPRVDAGPNMEVFLTDTVQLEGTVSDDGEPPGSKLTSSWTMVSGPGEVFFSDPADLRATASFSAAGTYVLKLTASDGTLTSSSQVSVSVDTTGSNNRPPVVDAGVAQSILLPLQIVTLQGAVTDDGFPQGVTPTVIWSTVMGPGAVVFANPTSPITTATLGIPGTYILRLTASDSELEASADVVITVTGGPPKNAAPAVTIGHDQTITLPDDVVFLSATALDDGLPQGALSYSWNKLSGPGPVSITMATEGNATARFQYPGEYLLQFVATDGELTGSAVMGVSVLPDPNNHPPQVSAGPELVVQLPAEATLSGSARDDGIPAWGTLAFAWSKVEGPGDVTLASPSEIRTRARFSKSGDYLLRLTVSDGELSASSEVKVTALAVNEPPLVSAGPSQTLSFPDKSTTLSGTTSDDGLPVGSAVTASWSVVQANGSVSFDSPSSPSTSVTFGYPGTYVLRLTATDSMLSSSSDVTITVGAREGEAPAVALSAPEDGAVLTLPTAVTGSVSSGDWKLEYRLGGEEAPASQPWVSIASGSEAKSGELGKIDPTLLLNGLYALRLTAISSGGSASASIHVSVEKNLKVGNFTVSFNDLSVPVAGIPIDVVRTYDSRDTAVGDFGVGWTLSVRNVRLEKSPALTKNWVQVIDSSSWIAQYCLTTSRPAFVTITFPGGKVYRFRAQMNPGCQMLYPIDLADLTFVPEPGTHGRLDALDIGDIQVQGQGGPVELTDWNERPINPRRFLLTTDEGTKYVINQGGGIESVTDANDNTLTISREGIIHSSGKSVRFTRDEAGRITGITDPAGHQMTYQYDGRGDLAAFVDREGSRTTFTYNQAHGLLDIFNPLGVRAVRNEYDSSGRLTKHIDPNGKEIVYTHNLAANQEIITDRLGNQRVLEYDGRGNIVQEINALGQATVRSYDSRDNKTSETDTLGHTTTWEYDEQDNVIKTTDPLGNVTKKTYNERRQILTTTNPRGAVTTTTYDSRGNLASATDPLGNVTQYGYDSAGNMTSQTDALGNVTRYEYDGFGNQTRVTSALGHSTTYEYDVNGHKLTESTQRTASSGIETLVTRFTHDKNGRVLQTTYPDGSSTKSAYNASGQMISSTDALNRVTAYEYDWLGRQTKTTYPDGTYEETGYDAEGRRISNTDRGRRTTQYEYDVLGRRTKTTFADGASTQVGYDQAGQKVASMDARGNVTSFVYDAAGRRTAVVDPLGNITSTVYDPAGNGSSVTDALGNVTQITYDLLNRQTKTTFADNTQTSTVYDKLSRRIAEVDQSGRITQYGFDAEGRLVSVTDGLNQVTAYSYDEIGNRMSQIDANGHETRFEYDKMGREITRLLPDGKFETKTYNLDGNLASRTDFMGRTTTYTYDEADRLLSKTYPDATAVSFTYSATGERLSATDARGTTSYSYDQRSRPTLLTYPDGRKLSYTYDAQGNRTSLTAIIGATSLTTAYTYNERNQISTVTDPDGRIFSYSYNENGSPTKLARPNGVETTYSYNGLNRLSALVTKLGASTIASYAYTLGPTGMRMRIDEVDGTVRAYGYDSLYRLTTETVAGGAGPNYTKSFTYDAVGNRLRQVTTGTGAADLAYAYDSRDRLLTEGAVSYSWNANGNLVGKAGSDQYEWDFEDRLVKVTKANGTVVENGYDADGILVRTSTEQPGNIAQVKDLLVDTTGGLSHVVAETVGGTGSLSVFYVRAGDHLLEEIRNGVTRFHLTDGLGSVRGLWDEMGSRTDAWDYSAFGETHLHTGSSANPYQFAGERFVGEVGLYQNRARWLDTGIGSFVSGDPARGNTSQPMTHHLYMYGSANPTNYSDPTGKFTYIDVLVATTIVGILSTVAINFVDNYRKHINAAIGVPNPENYPELKAAYSEQEFDKGVARLIRYWWSNESEHDIWEAINDAYNFRNRTYGLSQDIRVCAAERYLVGLWGSKEWGESYPPGKEWLYSTGKRIHPWIVPGFGSFPPSPYSANARDWYFQGLSGIGGQLHIVPNVDCWRFYENRQYWNFAYGPGVGNGQINPRCQ